MKKLKITFDGIPDSTGFLFSLAKCLAAAVKNSPYTASAEDLVATSGFAFRMWIDTSTLCPSALSCWNLDQQKPWVESGGFTCDYTGRYWEQEAIEAERRQAAIRQIKASVDRDTAAVVWDISAGEWGMVTGYSDLIRSFSTLKLNGKRDLLPYEKLGKLEIPILSVLTLTGQTGKSREAVFQDTLRLAVTHYRSQEPGDVVHGLAVYPELRKFLRDPFTIDPWNLKYYLGNYAALKQYALLYFQKQGQPLLAELYRDIFESWMLAFKLTDQNNVAIHTVRSQIADALAAAEANENQAMLEMERLLTGARPDSPCENGKQGASPS